MSMGFWGFGVGTDSNEILELDISSPSNTVSVTTMFSMENPWNGNKLYPREGFLGLDDV